MNGAMRAHAGRPSQSDKGESSPASQTKGITPSFNKDGQLNLLHVMYSSRSLLGEESELTHSLEAMNMASAQPTAEQGQMAAATMAELSDELRRLRAKVEHIVSTGGEQARTAADEFEAKTPPASKSAK